MEDRYLIRYHVEGRFYTNDYKVAEQIENDARRMRGEHRKHWDYYKTLKQYEVKYLDWDIERRYGVIGYHYFVGIDGDISQNEFEEFDQAILLATQQDSELKVEFQVAELGGCVDEAGDEDKDEPEAGDTAEDDVEVAGAALEVEEYVVAPEAFEASVEAEITQAGVNGLIEALGVGVVTDRQSAIRLVEEKLSEFKIDGKLTRANAAITATNSELDLLELYDDHLIVTVDNRSVRIEFDVPESEFISRLREVTAIGIERGELPKSFQVMGKSGAVYTYSEATLEVMTKVITVPSEDRAKESSKYSRLLELLKVKQKQYKELTREGSLASQLKANIVFDTLKQIVAALGKEKKMAA